MLVGGYLAHNCLEHWNVAIGMEDRRKRMPPIQLSAEYFVMMLSILNVTDLGLQSAPPTNRGKSENRF